MSKNTWNSLHRVESEKTDSNIRQEYIILESRMQCCVIWTILILGIFLTVANCQSQGPPTDADGNIICAPDDALCEKFKNMMGSSQGRRFPRKMHGPLAFRQGNNPPFRCDSGPWAKQLCESLGRVCYTDGRCDVLVSEEAKFI